MQSGYAPRYMQIHQWLRRLRMPRIDIGEQEIHYSETGSGDTLLMFPDNLNSSRAYDNEIGYFSDRFHVLSFDYPGTGRSTRNVKYHDEREYDLWNYWADFACHLLLALDIDGCYAMGTSGGALAALQFAGRQAKLHKLATKGVIADSFLGELDSRTLHRSLDVREHYYVRNAESLMQQHGDDWRQVVDADTSFLRRIADRGGYELPGFVLNSITCPVLLTGSLQDPLTPRISQELARISAIIPHCSVYLASESGHPSGQEHPLMWTDPDSFRKVSDMFLSRLQRAR
jgi:pimeloyl-ACP methyl ester carboxylesterase